MDSKTSCSQLSSPWPRDSRCLIQRLAQEAEREFAGSNGNNGNKKKPGKASSSPSESSSRRQSHEGRSLSDTIVVSEEEQILDDSYDQFSRTFHMVLLDPNYDIFTSPKRLGSIIYKIAQRTLIVVGDPLCSNDNLQAILEELRQFRRARRLKLAFMGVSESFLDFATKKGWSSFKFGCERVINPLNNEVLNKKSGKRMLGQNRQLLDPKRGGLKIGIYVPSATGINRQLERSLEQLYTNWCGTKHDRGMRNTQAFITAYDIFSQRTKTAFLYTTDAHGDICGMAMLRQLGVEAGFHVDPCIASADAPKGTTDLLMVTAMQILRRAEISYLSLGVEPCMALKEESKQLGMSDRLANAAYRKVTNYDKVVGKKTYNDKFHPDPSLQSNLYVVFPKAVFPLQEALAIMKVAHIRLKHIFA
ncbi:hypothetical protein QQS21_000365 [Conoideocrella luteorostrata]|uniref:Phosphatidylglycerol lysyltransferase C-terminal domain-containing protein n=1 Tax=Conoideocrella luteorostrata TaxID=1105319 RepID=A0AAJ0CZ47_9HYPO|nr:hypothetical protein QQS21_000365 [Conoideocrella luteorostrata]